MARRLAGTGSAHASEAVEQQHIVQLIRSVGGKVWVLGTTRRRGDYQGTMQTPGIPDLVAFIPVPTRTADGRELGRQPQLVFIECKRQGGRLRPEQVVFRDECGFAKVEHIVGTMNAVIAWMAVRGVVKADAFPHYRQPVQGVQ